MSVFRCNSWFCLRLGLDLHWGLMDKGKVRWKFLVLITVTFTVILYTQYKEKSSSNRLLGLNTNAHSWSRKRLSPPLKNTKHLLGSAVIDQRLNGNSIHIIGIFKRESIQPLYCLLCCGGQLSTSFFYPTQTILAFPMLLQMSHVDYQKDAMLHM